MLKYRTASQSTEKILAQDTSKVQVDEIPIPKIKDDEILVKMGSASLCHSDLMLIEGSIPGDGNPVTLGHEGVGYVEDCGADVQGYKKGDRIGFLYIKGCCCTFKSWV